MAAIPLNEAGVRNMKRALVGQFPKDKSSHISEALAASMGFKTNMALVAAIRDGNPDDPDYVLLNEAIFLARLAGVTGRKMSVNNRSLIFDNIRFADGNSPVRTLSPGYRRTKYAKNARLRAWRNMLVAGINAAIDRRLFTILPGDNRWPNCDPDRYGKRDPHVFAFEIAQIPALCSVHDAGYDELSIHVALWPTTDSARWLPAAWAGFQAGDAYASGWLERRDGAWLQVSTQPLRDQFSCRRARLPQVAALDVQPEGYADRGSFRL
jgi:hypothetical protein